MTNDVQIKGWNNLTEFGVNELLRIVGGWSVGGVCPLRECQTCPMSALTAEIKNSYSYPMFSIKVREYNVCTKNVGMKTERYNDGKIFIARDDMIELIEYEMAKRGMNV